MTCHTGEFKAPNSLFKLQIRGDYQATKLHDASSALVRNWTLATQAKPLALHLQITKSPNHK